MLVVFLLDIRVDDCAGREHIVNGDFRQGNFLFIALLVDDPDSSSAWGDVCIGVERADVEVFAGVDCTDVEVLTGVERTDVEVFAGVERTDVEVFAGVERADVEVLTGVERTRDEIFSGTERVGGQFLVLTETRIYFLHRL